MSIQITTLPSGLRVITDSVPAVESAAVGIWAAVGTRHEDMQDNGVAHMVEHMMFKGTPTRSAAQIAEQIEDVGGQMNAYTSREITSYHMHLLKEDLPLALTVLADLIQNPLMPDDEVERERHVILQEIGMTLDTPDDIIFDYYQETAYPDQALGAPILGRPGIIKAMSRDTLMDYVRRCYTPARLVVSAAGNLDHDLLVALAGDLFAALPADQAVNESAAAYRGGEHRTEKELEQSHIVLGFDGVARGADEFFAAGLLSTLLGGGMSSRLFQEIREKRGLVYSVFSHFSPYQDGGQFLVYAGTGPDDLPELVPVLCDELGKVTQAVSDEELGRAKAQMRAALLMGRESMMRRANQQAKHLIHFGTAPDIQDKLAKLEAVSAADVSALAARLFAGPPTLAALGPLGRLESYDTLSGRLTGRRAA